MKHFMDNPKMKNRLLDIVMNFYSNLKKKSTKKRFEKMQEEATIYFHYVSDKHFDDLTKQ